MMSIHKIGLLTVTHDPLGKNIDLFKRLKKVIEDLYPELYMAISEESSIKLIREIENSNFNIKIIPKKGAAFARRAVLNFGLTGECGFYHYVDFDRLLTWANNHLVELKELKKMLTNQDYMIIGRTERAMNTHPVEWIETERITNKICSIELSMDVDITAGSCGFSRESAEYIHKYSNDKMTDGEWPMIVDRMADLRIGYIAVEGLEYFEEINGISRPISDSEKWLDRLRLSLIISESAIKTGR
ncbi:hypothetical protein [Falsibacillus albus]|uniref:Glycosyltransferase family 2 protein n=1 Tax=Falsibacillus albus TaxID=2478915 RepID=A0A3L7JTU6_9BACI|nr:hypothetical protein [Falsibacillus albus]RLQ94273.1 hypothetical protein D9X91_14525 [Falsibacillus albus]